MALRTASVQKTIEEANTTTATGNTGLPTLLLDLFMYFHFPDS